MMDGVEGKFKTVGYAEFVKDVVKMVLHSLFADEELLADFLVAKPLSDVLNDFLFPFTEERLLAARPRFRGLRERLHDFGSHEIIQPDFSSVNALNAPYEEIGRRLLEDHAASAEAHGTDDITVVFGGGQNNNASGQIVKIDLFQNSQPCPSPEL